MVKQGVMLRQLITLEGTQIAQGLEALKKATKMPPAIPVEQIQGDIARAGHPVQRLMALDPEARRLFFTDIQGAFMYAEFASEEDAYRVIRVGHQSEIIKEYDPVDLTAEPRDAVTTGHSEAPADYSPEPGVIPSGSSDDHPKDKDGDGFGDDPLPPSRVPVGDIRDRHEENSGSAMTAHTDALEEHARKELKELGGFVGFSELHLSLAELSETIEKQPPRPGLVPQSGDPQHPGRWVSPESGKLPKRTGETMGEAIAISSPSGRMSGRSRKAALARLARSLFGEEGLQKPKGPVESRQHNLLRRASELRGLAARGMKPRAYAKEADKLEAEALEIDET